MNGTGSERQELDSSDCKQTEISQSTNVLDRKYSYQYMIIFIWHKYRAASQVQSSLNTKIYNLYDVLNVNMQASLNQVSVSISLSTLRFQNILPLFQLTLPLLAVCGETLTDRPDMTIAVYRRC